jgi:hypothetical protein
MSDINTLAQYNQKIVESLTINVHFIWANCKNLICWDCFVASSWQWLQRHHLSLQAKRGNPILEYFCNYLIFYRLMITEIFLGDCRVNNRLEILWWWKVMRSDKGKSVFRLTETSYGYSNTHRVLQTHGTCVFLARNTFSCLIETSWIIFRMDEFITQGLLTQEETIKPKVMFGRMIEKGL